MLGARRIAPFQILTGGGDQNTQFTKDFRPVVREVEKAEPTPVAVPKAPSPAPESVVSSETKTAESPVPPVLVDANSDSPTPIDPGWIKPPVKRLAEN
jgi:hypothetical protein